MSKYYYAVISKKGEILFSSNGQLYIYRSKKDTKFKCSKLFGETIKRILITDLQKLLL